MTQPQNEVGMMGRLPSDGQEPKGFDGEMEKETCKFRGSGTWRATRAG